MRAFFFVLAALIVSALPAQAQSSPCQQGQTYLESRKAIIGSINALGKKKVSPIVLSLASRRTMPVRLIYALRPARLPPSRLKWNAAPVSRPNSSNQAGEVPACSAAMA
jgi:hypothetical protein